MAAADSVWIGWLGPIQFQASGSSIIFPGQLVGPAADNTAAPPFTFLNDLDTGYASSAANTLALVAGGTTRLSVSSTAVTSTVPFLGPNGTLALPAFAAAAEPSTGMYFPAAGMVGIGGIGQDDFVITNTSVKLSSTQLFGWTLGGAFANGYDLILSRENAAVLKMGLDAAGVTDQMFKGPDRITSDGVGGNLTIAGGRNRGASAGGSVIFQTAPAAGAGVTGTLATALTIDSTKQATFTGNINNGGNGVVTTALQSNSNGNRINLDAGASLITITNSASSVGYGLGFATDGLMLVRDRAGSGAGAIGLTAAMAMSGTAPTAAGTGMTIAVGTGSTAFAFTLTITTANAQSAFTLTLPTATNGWQVFAQSLTNPGSMKISVSSRSTTTAVLTQYSQTTGLAAAYADANVIFGIAIAN